MKEYEIVNESTGEIELFKTGIDIKQLEEYNQWRIDNRLNPPTYSPQEYAEYIENQKNRDIIIKAKNYLAAYNMGVPLPSDMLDRLERILDGEE